MAPRPGTDPDLSVNFSFTVGHHQAKIHMTVAS